MGKLTAFIVAIAAASFVSSAEAQNRSGNAVVRSLEGSADYSDGSGVWRPLRVGKTLDQGMIVRTSAGSSVDLYLDENGPWVRVNELTTLGLERLAYERAGDEYVIDTRLDLKDGSITGHVSKTSSASKYEVKTSTMVAGIRGPSDYRITAAGLASILNGQAVVVFVDPQSGETSTHLVNSGQTFDPNQKAVRAATPAESPIVEYAEGAAPEEEMARIEEVPFVAPITSAFKAEHVQENDDD